jgi:fructose-1,6-bisphosphatase/inositol monophosphatase family enzyme
MIKDIGDFLPIIKALHERIRNAVVAECERSALESLSRIAKEEEGDTIYAIDRVSEELLVEFFESEIAPHTAIVLIAEGLDGGRIVLPRGATAEDAHWRVIVDPIDGTRGLMYQKRSAWILTGVAPNRGEDTNLFDIEIAMQTEIPLVKQHLSDTLWAETGKGANAERFDRIAGKKYPLELTPSAAASVAHGFASMSRFFAGVSAEATAVYDEIIFGALGPVQPGKAHCFEDQYISTGGQLYELIAGHDRFIADLRPVFEKDLTRRGKALGICCHPYDLCTELIAREYGVQVTDEYGRRLSAQLSVEPDAAWIGYANSNIRAQIEPLLNEALRNRNLLGPES